MSVQVTVLKRLSDRANVYRASVRGLLSGQVTVQSGYYLVGLPAGRVTVCWESVHRATVCRGYGAGNCPSG